MMYPRSYLSLIIRSREEALKDSGSKRLKYIKNAHVWSGLGLEVANFAVQVGTGCVEVAWGGARSPVFGEGRARTGWRWGGAAECECFQRLAKARRVRLFRGLERWDESRYDKGFPV